MRGLQRVRGVWLAVMCAGAVCAAHAAQPDTGPLGIDAARHLLLRASFAAAPDEIQQFSRLTRGDAADRLLAQTSQPRVTPPPVWVNEPVVPASRLRTMSADERRDYQRNTVARGVEMRGWWLHEMAATPAPLAEKMALFWHNHFVSSQQKVRQPQYLYRQNLLLREHALGNFGVFLHAMARDPAMVIYLDSASNRKGQPNENFAREVMELFTLGEGHYSERDVKEAARAFTGWSIDGETGAFLFRAPAHDDGEKTVLGRSGALDGDAVIDILLAQPQTAEFIVRKLWREFVSPEPDAGEVRRIAGVLRDSRYDIRTALRALLTSDAFYAPQHRAALVKSPVDLVVGTLRQFQMTAGDVPPFALVVAQLGQNLFSPPNVKGWPGGEAWINSTTLLARKQFLEQLFRSGDPSDRGEPRPAMAMQPQPLAQAQGAAASPLVASASPLVASAAPLVQMRQRLQRAMSDMSFDSQRWLREAGGDAAQVPRLMLAMAPQHALPPGASGMEAIRRLTQDPVYQLK